jgi:hypothetical protein
MVFGVCMGIICVLYLALFSFLAYYYIDDCQQGWHLLRLYLYWWHVGFFAVSAVIFLIITIKLYLKIDSLNGRFKKKKRTLKVLGFLAILTVFRSMVDGVFEHVPESNKIAFIYWDTWIGFFTYFTLESLIPSVIFLLLLGKIPSLEQRERLNRSRYDSGFVPVPVAGSTTFGKIMNF